MDGRAAPKRLRPTGHDDGVRGVRPGSIDMKSCFCDNGPPMILMQAAFS
jgi:hypothetical protein